MLVKSKREFEAYQWTGKNKEFMEKFYSDISLLVIGVWVVKMEDGCFQLCTPEEFKQNFERLDGKQINENGGLRYER